jgi:hypothetical protein
LFVGASSPRVYFNGVASRRAASRRVSRVARAADRPYLAGMHASLVIFA